MHFKTPMKAFVDPKNNIPKSLRYFFLASQLLFGFDFGFSAIVKKRYRTLVKLLTFIIYWIAIVILFTPCAVYQYDLWYWFIFLEYFAYFIVLNLTKYSAYNLIYDVTSLSKTSLDVKLGYKMMIFNIVMYLMKALLAVIKCYNEEDGGDYCTNDPWFYFNWINSVPSWLGMNALAATQTIIFTYIRFGAKTIREYLKGRKDNLTILQCSYINLADFYNKIRPFIDYMTSIELIINIPKMMAVLWYMLYCIKRNEKWFSYVLEMIFALQIAIQIALPAIVAELVNSEVDAIKLLLNQQLLECKDEVKSAEMNRMIQYIESRPLRHLVWRFIPLDMRLLTALVGICTTYFIVIIQFTHLYD